MSDCIDPKVITHNIEWQPQQCVDGGILRARRTYTNLEVSGFNTDVGYSGHYYGIRKYEGLIPNAPYFVNLELRTGDGSRLEVPREIREWEYGSNEQVAYSGTKIINTYQPKQRYGKSVAVSEEYLAVGMPYHTFQDTEGHVLENAGSILIYKRNPPPSGFDWSDQYDKAGWILEQEVNLPSGILRDYISSKEKTRKLPNLGTELPFFVERTFWKVGQNGRQLGYSVDICSTDNLEPSLGEDKKHILVASGPSAKFDRVFDDTPPSGVGVCLMLINDNFFPEITRLCGFQTTRSGDRVPIYCTFGYPHVLRSISDLDLLFRYFAQPKTKFDVKLGIFEALTQNNNKTIVNFPEPKPTFILKKEIIRHEGITNFSNPIFQQRDNAIFEAFKETFFQLFPYDETKINNNIPAILAFYIDQTRSITDRAVSPAFQRFIDFYKDYSFASGLKTIDGVPSAGHVVVTGGVAPSWPEEVADLLRETLDLNNLQENDAYKLFATSIGSLNSDATELNVVPPSGGSVYIFEKENGSWNLIQEIESPTQLSNIYPDRFGHCVRISDNGEIIVIGSPYIGADNLMVYEYDDRQKRGLYNNVENWLLSKASQETTSVKYRTLLNIFSSISKNTPSQIEAGKQMYSILSADDKFQIRKDLNIQEYEQTFKASRDFDGGAWSFLTDEVAPCQRAGYSVATNEDGSVIAMSSPTDSYTEDPEITYYFSPLRPEISTWPSYINTGSVKVFESRKYFPHSLVLDYGKFGNLHFEISSQEEKKYFNYFEQIYRSMGLEFKATEFVDPVIPEQAGLVFIISPQVDALSDEVFTNIRNWLALGDRNLVVVGNDPVWEKDGIYKESNDIINKLLRRLNSGLIIVPARNEFESLPTYDINKRNIDLSFIPTNSLIPLAPVPGGDLYGSGVGDIKPYFPDEGFTYKCTVNPDRSVGSLASIFEADGINLTYAAANDKCEIPLYHLGDLRSQWKEWCLTQAGIECVPITYPYNWPLYFGSNGLSPQTYGCNCDTGDALQSTEYFEYNNVPLLVAGEYPEPFVVTIPASPATSGEFSTFTRVPAPPSILKFLGDRIDPSGDPEIIWSSGSINYLSLNTNTTNVISNSRFFDPSPYNDKDAVLQARAESFIVSNIIQRPFDSANYIATERYLNTDSQIIMMAGTISETEAVLENPKQGDPNFYYNFYVNLLYQTPLGDTRIAQLSDWTGRSSFKDLNPNSILPKVITSIFCDVDENVSTSKLLFGMTREEGDVVNRYEYDVCWIAEPKGLPSNLQLEFLKSWIARGNKKVIITYQNYNDEVAMNRINTLAEMLNVSMGPMFLPNKNRYANVSIDTSRSFRFDPFLPVFPNIRDSFLLKPFSNLVNVSNVPANPNFIPIKTANSFPLASLSFNDVEDGGGLITANFITDDFVDNQNWWKYQTGIAEVVFPTIAGSGYELFISTVSESPSEYSRLQFKINNVIRESFLNSDSVRIDDILIDVRPRMFDGTISTESVKFIADTDKTSISITHFFDIPEFNFRVDNDLFPRTTRLLAMSGVLLPVSTAELANFKLLETKEWIVKEEIPETKLTVTPGFRPISTDNSKYCPDPGDCLNQLGGKLIEDGPVVFAQEIEKFSRFDFGVNRSRITVISDSSLIQGPSIVDQDDRINPNVIQLLQGLYPFTNFPSLTRGRSYTDHITKIQCPERCSPAVLFNLTGNPGHNLRFESPTVASSGRNISDYVLSFNTDNVIPLGSIPIHRPPRYLITEEREVPRGGWPPGVLERIVKEEQSGILNAFKNQAGSWGSYSKFAQTIEGKYYEDVGPAGGVPQILQDTGYDFLDFDRFPSGYAGNLFGYSIDLYGNKLLIGSPFAPFDTEEIISWPNVLNTTQYTIPSGFTLGYNGGAGVTYLYEQFRGDGVNPIQDTTIFGKPSRWVLTKKFRPTQINVGQDVFDPQNSISVLGQNNYSSGDLSLSIVNDQFGHSVRIYSDMIAIGAPGHDFDNYIEEVYESGAFMRKSFDESLDIPERIIYDLGDPAIRNAINSGVPVLNNGAIFTYENRIDDWQIKSQDWKMIQKILPQAGYNSRKQKNYVNNIAISGSENDRFGSNIDIFLSKRSDSDYTLAAGCPSHMFADSGDPILDFGTVYVNDGILRRMPTSKVDPDSWMQGRVFGETDDKNNPILYFGFSNSGTDFRMFQSGIIYSNDQGEIFLEASGQDIVEKLYIRHRPFVKSIYGRYFFGDPSFDKLGMFIDGEIARDNQSMNLFFGVKDSHEVYNQLGLYQSAVLGIASGVPSGLNLFMFSPNGELAENSGLFLYSDGLGIINPSGLENPDFLSLRVRGK
jgi:hypothetical protein